MILLGIIALVVIGPKELPVLARTLGRFMNELKRSTESLTDDIKQQTNLDIDIFSKSREQGHQYQEAKPLDPESSTTSDAVEGEQLEFTQEDKKDEKQ